MDHGQPFMYLELVKDIDRELNEEMGNDKLLALMDAIDLSDCNDFHYWVFEYKATLRERLFRVESTPTKEG